MKQKAENLIHPLPLLLRHEGISGIKTHRVNLVNYYAKIINLLTFYFLICIVLLYESRQNTKFYDYIFQWIKISASLPNKPVF